MLPQIQTLLDDIASTSDNRTTVFDVQAEEMENGMLSLNGRMLDESQLKSLAETLSRQFRDLKLDIASVNILNRPNLPRLHVATNLTGLYEKPTFGMPLSSELYFGTEVEVLEEKHRWVFTRQRDGYLGWAYKPYLAEGDSLAATHLVLAPAIELRAELEANSEVITRLVSGTGVVVGETSGDWARVIANQTGWMPAVLLRSAKDFPQTDEARRAKIVEDSARMIGVPYLWGGTSGNGIDCSGFVRLLHHWIGIETPRDADMQHAAAKPVEPPFEIGDLFFFAEGDGDRKVTHVGISLGGWKMIHSSRGRNGVYMDDVQKKDSLRAIYLSAGSFLR